MFCHVLLSVKEINGREEVVDRPANFLSFHFNISDGKSTGYSLSLLFFSVSNNSELIKFRLSTPENCFIYL